MEALYKIIGLLGGLAMFLYGMRIMGDGLKSISGGAMKTALGKVTNRPVMGFLLGTLVTCVIQSSHATIVITVGLVGAGLLTFRQSIGVILGANVGTAITAQIIRLMDVDAGSGSLLNLFSANNLAPIALIIGIVCIMFLKSSSSKSAGTIAMGFGILFMGLIFMKDSVSSMAAGMGAMLTTLEGRYFLGFLSGLTVTCIIQSSSAVIGIIQSFASSVGIPLCAIVAVIIGVNMGDCLSAYIVTRIGAKPEQNRTILVHVIYNIFAATLIIICLVVGRSTGLLNENLWHRILDSGGIANLHGLFRLVPAVLLMPLCGLFARIAERIVPDRPMDEEDADIVKHLQELDDRLLTSPAIALDTVAHLIGHMGDVALHNYDAAVTQLYAYDPQRDARIDQREDLLDRMADSSNNYIVSVSPHVSLKQDTQNQYFQIKALTCFERIGDLAMNINDNVSSLRDARKHFTPNALAELQVAIDAVSDILTLSVDAYKTNDLCKARMVEPLEEVIDELIEDLKGRHVYRVTHQHCDVFNGIYFQNILQNMERVSDQCSDLALYMLARSDESIAGNEHQYLHNLHHSDNQEYLTKFHENYDMYFGKLAAIAPMGPVETAVK